MPEQKSLPAPVTSTTRTLSSTAEDMQRVPEFSQQLLIERVAPLRTIERRCARSPAPLDK